MTEFRRTARGRGRELAAAQIAARANVDDVIDRVRRRFVTPIAGQEMIYQDKEREARAWQATPQPQLADFPFIAAAVGIRAADGDAVAALFLARAAQLRRVAASLEPIRERALEAISGAVDAAAVSAAQERFYREIGAWGPPNPESAAHD